MKRSDSVSLRQLRCFVTVAEELHFRRAAERLHMRQPPLTQRIQDLERELGVALFIRTGNRVELTDAGTMVLEAAKGTLAQAEGVREAAERAARGDAGRIRVGLTMSALFFRSIQQAIREFQQQHPGVSLELGQISSGPALECLRQRKLDACLTRAFQTPVPPDCEEVVIARDRLMLVLPMGHPLAGSERIPLSAVANDGFISLACKRGMAVYQQTLALWEKSGLRPRITQEAENGPSVVALVAAGLGNAVLPSSLRAIRLEHVVWKPIEIEERWTETSLNLVYRKDSLDERLPAAFIDCLRRHSDASAVVRQFG